MRLGRALQAKFSANTAKAQRHCFKVHSVNTIPQVVVALKEHVAQIFDTKSGRSEQLFKGHMGHVLTETGLQQKLT